MRVLSPRGCETRAIAEFENKQDYSRNQLLKHRAFGIPDSKEEFLSNFPRHDLASQVVESSEEEQPEWALKLHLDVHLRATRQYVDVSSGFGGPAKSVRAFLDNHERHSTTQRLVLESVAKADHQSSRDVDRERQHGEQTYNHYQAFSYSQPIEQRQGSHRGQVLHHFGQIFQEEACRSSLGRLRATYPRERHVFSPRRQSVRSR